MSEEVTSWQNEVSGVLHKLQAGGGKGEQEWFVGGQGAPLPLPQPLTASGKSLTPAVSMQELILLKL